jgi:hypothetical protein
MSHRSLDLPLGATALASSSRAAGIVAGIGFIPVLGATRAFVLEHEGRHAGDSVSKPAVSKPIPGR